MQFYIGDYMADAGHLSRCDHGAYLLLLFAMWRAGGQLPNDPARLAALARCTKAEWPAVGAVVMPFFIVSEDHITQSRLTREIAKYQDVVEERKKAGQQGGLKKAANRSAALAIATQPEPEPEPEVGEDIKPRPNGRVLSDRARQ